MNPVDIFTSHFFKVRFNIISIFVPWFFEWFSLVIFLAKVVLCVYRVSFLCFFMEVEGSLPCSQEPSAEPCPKPDQPSSDHPILLILSSHLRLGLPSGFFPFGFPTKILYVFLFYPMLTMCPFHLILFEWIILFIFGEEYRLWSSSFCSFLQPPTTPSLFDPNIPSAPCSEITYRQLSSLNIVDQVSHSYNYRQNYSFVYFSFYVFRQPTRRQKVLNGMVASITRIQSPLNFLVN
jgi:hypothetical protein